MVDPVGLGGGNGANLLGAAAGAGDQASFDQVLSQSLGQIGAIVALPMIDMQRENQEELYQELEK